MKAWKKGIILLMILLVFETGCLDEKSTSQRALPASTIQPETTAPHSPDPSRPPISPLSEAHFDYEFGNPTRIEIKGYMGDAMEPFISKDDSYLFFNNLNSPEVNTNIHLAEAVGENKFRYVGEVRGVNTDSLEGVASMDSSGRFYFVSTRSYGDSKRTLYHGFFKDGGVSGVDLVQGDISRDKIPWLNMDAEISFDGRSLYFTENEFDLLRGLPKTSNIKVAVNGNGEFKTLENSDYLLHNINTDALEYTPSISSDGLVIFFTRAKDLGSKDVELKIFGAKRNNVDEPFGPPKAISSITGFVEAPSISNDRNTLYYHKKEEGTHNIYKVSRKN
jgi:hypothetical protein